MWKLVEDTHHRPSSTVTDQDTSVNLAFSKLVSMFQVEDYTTSSCRVLCEDLKAAIAAASGSGIRLKESPVLEEKPAAKAACFVASFARSDQVAGCVNQNSIGVTSKTALWKGLRISSMKCLYRIVK